MEVKTKPRKRKVESEEKFKKEQEVSIEYDQFIVNKVFITRKRENI